MAGKHSFCVSVASPHHQMIAQPAAASPNSVVTHGHFFYSPYVQCSDFESVRLQQKNEETWST